jgi:hypothetical protein
LGTQSSTLTTQGITVGGLLLMVYVGDCQNESFP